MAKVSGPVDVATQVDLIHVNCGVHMAAILHDPATGSVVFECNACKACLVVSHFDQNLPGEQPEEKGPEEPAKPVRAKRRSQVAISC